MPHEVVASLVVPLPDDAQQMAATLSFIAKTWSEMLTTLSGETGSNVHPKAQLNVHEVRAKAKSNSGQDGRKTRARTTTQETKDGDQGQTGGVADAAAAARDR